MSINVGKIQFSPQASHPWYGGFLFLKDERIEQVENIRSFEGKAPDTICQLTRFSIFHESPRPRHCGHVFQPWIYKHSIPWIEKVFEGKMEQYLTLFYEA
jgi:hypothetical protein